MNWLNTMFRFDRSVLLQCSFPQNSLRSFQGIYNDELACLMFGLCTVLVGQGVSSGTLRVFPSYFRPAICWLGFDFAHTEDFLDKLGGKEQHLVDTQAEDLSAKAQSSEDSEDLFER